MYKAVLFEHAKFCARTASQERILIIYAGGGGGGGHDFLAKFPLIRHTRYCLI